MLKTSRRAARRHLAVVTLTAAAIALSACAPTDEADSGSDTGDELVLGGEGERVVMSGLPSELVLHCYGREQSVVELSGRPSAVERLRAANLGI